MKKESTISFLLFILTNMVITPITKSEGTIDKKYLPSSDPQVTRVLKRCKIIKNRY